MRRKKTNTKVTWIQTRKTELEKRGGERNLEINKRKRQPGSEPRRQNWIISRDGRSISRSRVLAQDEVSEAGCKSELNYHEGAEFPLGREETPREMSESL